MTDETRVTVDEIRARRTAVTPGEWHACKDGACICAMVWDASGNVLLHDNPINDEGIPVPTLEQGRLNAAFIAKAPTDIDALLAALATAEQHVREVDAVAQALRDEVAALQDRLAALDPQPEPDYDMPQQREPGVLYGDEPDPDGVS